jgi:acyl-CoA synthetase (AMP-forming)/AMP-acid ligase II
VNIAAPLFQVSLRLPERPAISGDAGVITYAALAERAARLGGALRDQLRLAPGDRVAIDMENCPEFIEALFGAWTAGLCAVPINAKLHAREVAYIVQKSGARVLFTTAAHADELAQVEAETKVPLVVAADERWRRLLRADPVRPAAAAPTDPAWLFFTSGTTGRPKGAVLSHRALLFMVHAYYADIDFVDETDTKIHAAPLSHGSGLYGLAFLFRGANNVIPGGSFDPPKILELIARYPNVTFFAAPTMLTRLVGSDAIRSANLSNLKTIYYGGGPMYVADLKRALATFGPRLYQLFGQGESPMTITGLSKRLHATTDHPRYEALLASCGYPRTGVEVRVVDEHDEDVPPGEVGEVVTRSDAMMSEYYGEPAATAETLRGGWLHTGDLGSMDGDGLVTLRDRSKDMIISGGSNIYPREIEEVLLRHPDVLEASVIGRPHADWGEEVVAFVVPRPGRALAADTLDALCLDNIARFKRPRHYRLVAALPKNNYGKVLKTELRRQLEEERR